MTLGWIYMGVSVILIFGLMIVLVVFSGELQDLCVVTKVAVTESGMSEYD